MYIYILIFSVYVYIIKKRSMLTYMLQTYAVIQISSMFLMWALFIARVADLNCSEEIMGTSTRDVAVFETQPLNIVTSCTE